MRQKSHTFHYVRLCENFVRLPTRLMTTLALAITALTELSSLGLNFMGTIWAY